MTAVRARHAAPRSPVPRPPVPRTTQPPPLTSPSPPPLDPPRRHVLHHRRHGASRRVSWSPLERRRGSTPNPVGHRTSSSFIDYRPRPLPLPCAALFPDRRRGSSRSFPCITPRPRSFFPRLGALFHFFTIHGLLSYGIHHVTSASSWRAFNTHLTVTPLDAVGQDRHARRHRRGGRERHGRVRQEGGRVPQPDRPRRGVSTRGWPIPRLLLLRVPVGVPGHLDDWDQGPEPRHHHLLRSSDVAEDATGRPERRARWMGVRRERGRRAEQSGGGGSLSRWTLARVYPGRRERREVRPRPVRQGECPGGNPVHGARAVGQKDGQDREQRVLGDHPRPQLALQRLRRAPGARLVSRGVARRDRLGQRLGLSRHQQRGVQVRWGGARSTLHARNRSNSPCVSRDRRVENDRSSCAPCSLHLPSGGPL